MALIVASYPCKSAQAAAADHAPRSAWQEAFPLESTQRLAYDPGPTPRDRQPAMLWGEGDYQDIHVRDSWNSRIARDRMIRGSLSQYAWYDMTRRLLYGDTQNFPSTQRESPWRSPPPKEDQRRILINTPPQRERVTRVPWVTPELVKRSTRIPWGDGSIARGTWPDVPRPPDDWKPDATYTTIQDVYIVINTAYVTRVIDNMPIDVGRVSLSIDMDSWAWQFSMDVLRQEHLEALTVTLPMDVRISINGVEWICAVEQYGRSRRFGGTTWTVSGRSRSAELAAPWADTQSYIETQVRNAQQLALAEVTTFGWGLDWRLVDWEVDPECYHYQDLTPLAAVQKIAAAAGGVVQSHQSDKTLIVQARYPTKPWDWLSAQIERTLPDSAVLSDAGSFERRPEWNGIVVSGVTQGVTVNVTRYGTNGAVQAPMVTDDLITHVDAGRERGANELARAGNWLRQSLTLPLLDLPGLLTPGDLVSGGAGGSEWRAQVQGVRVTASFDGQRGLTVLQTVEVLRDV